MARSNHRAGRAASLEGLDEALKDLSELPAKLRSRIRGAVNEQAALTRNEMVSRIAADGIRQSAVKSRIQFKRATVGQEEATLTLNTRRVPFSQVQFTTQVTDTSGTRASVWVSRGGKRGRVYGFVNPYGRTRKPMIRTQKGSISRLSRAAGVGLKAYWNGIISDAYVDSLKRQLRDRIAKRITV